METKVCSKCGVTKMLDAFCKHPKGYLKRASQCKACDKVYRAQAHVAERIVAHGKQKAKRRKELRLRHHSREYARKYMAAARQQLKDHYVLQLIGARHGISREAIRAHPTLTILYKKELELKRMSRAFHVYPVLSEDKKAKRTIVDLKCKLKRRLARCPNHKLAPIWRERLEILQSRPWPSFTQHSIISELKTKPTSNSHPVG